MRRIALASLALVLPLSVLALDYTNQSSKYTDAPFTKPEEAAISLLTNLGIVQGNPDGSFAPRRTINRAEFLKMVLLGKDVTSTVADSEAASCFPDVRAQDWFAKYVCSAKKNGIVSGYADGSFKPEQPVNYVEALKMLVGTFQYALSTTVSDPWYVRYVQAATERKTLLPVSVSYDDPLTRGQMARLLAGFIAESKGELAIYRAREQGQTLSSISSAASSTSSTSSTVSSAVSSAASSVSSSASSLSSSVSALIPGLPVTSHFLILGTHTLPIASAAFRPTLEPVHIRKAEVKMTAKINSIAIMEVVAVNGTILGQLTVDSSDSSGKTWKGTFTGSGQYEILKDVEQDFAIRLWLKTKDEGGIPDQNVQVDTFRLTADGEWSQATYMSDPQNFTFSPHRTALGTITSVKNGGDATGALPEGANRLLADFLFTGSGSSDAALALENLEFSVTKSSGIAITNWQLGSKGGNVRVQCAVDGTTVSCVSIPEELGSLGSSPRELQLFGDVTVDAGVSSAFLHADLLNPGNNGQISAVQWRDFSGHYNWVELPSPVALGTQWKR